MKTRKLNMGSDSKCIDCGHKYKNDTDVMTHDCKTIMAKNRKPIVASERAAKPTPTPWKTLPLNPFIFDKDEESVALVDCRNRTTNENRANATFIVRAVNSHEELIAAVKSMFLYINTYGGEVTSNFTAGGNGEAYKALIAKSEGK